MDYIIRDVRPRDLDEVLCLNEEVVPAVNSVPLEMMQWFAKNAAYFRVASKDHREDNLEDNRLAAFLIGMRPGTTYQSLNYRWFCDHYDDFAYIDRVAVAGHARRNGLATILYDDFRQSVPADVSVMTCEVNLRPPNETSMRFHERYGFEQVGSQATEGGDKKVALMARQQ